MATEPLASVDMSGEEAERWLALAVKFAVANVESGGGGPFASIIVRSGEVIGRGVNRVIRDLDPTAHSEIVAIRAACRQALHFRLPGAVLVSTCEPCPMCLTAALWADVGRIVYAVDRHEAAAAGFPQVELYDLFEDPQHKWTVPVGKISIAQAQDPFEAWQRTKPQRQQQARP
ncbi:nucleoside deaminase [Catellatospora sp. NPDC049111]|uniref:nucleoside deaminase n=1 Tax=Catellatospora sp. NPDC049111 TaxID=3155271 RepID=UPI003400ED65